ncbi:ABC-type amino acid transport substrate-binding protein [Bosea sp. OAE506]|uniref:hypothetical protein n=1 Tax=Bosea sp. OAE506 TaxID=2663870 RepID=UPI00339461B2
MTMSRFACLLAACLGLGATAPVSARSLDDILKAGELRVGVNPTLPPRALFNEKNEIDGFEPELAKAGGRQARRQAHAGPGRLA